ncbi:hypothetical protein H2200_001892 [Cladophialophora chaetospira]|uniref:IBR domain-containing protein n=1 Tax=Cladophialophora chaetospira TaxID=386627 RepID=A0AA38XML7_9EURO|nr:hypothetical protein H2200_001892 [Cladophialophora chaetospira]
MEADADDAASARTVLRLQLEEIEEAVNATTDPVEIAILNNQAAAFRAQYQEVVKSDRIQSDQRMQKSVCQAMLSDFPVVDVLLEQEASTSAARVQRQPGNGTAPPPLREHGRDGYFDDPRVDPNGNADVETFIESLTIDEKHAPRQCYMCTDNQGYSQTTIVGDCDHVWCRSCLTEAFELATKNESNYPVRCCRDSPIIPLDHPGIVSLVGHELISAVQAKVVEYETADKTYCHDPKCSTFIVPTTIEEARAVCATCQKITCAQCKAEYHGEEECKTANDEAFEQWQQLPQSRDHIIRLQSYEVLSIYPSPEPALISVDAFAELNSAMNAARLGRPAGVHVGMWSAFLNELK